MSSLWMSSNRSNLRENPKINPMHPDVGKREDEGASLTMSSPVARGTGAAPKRPLSGRTEVILLQFSQPGKSEAISLQDLGRSICKVWGCQFYLVN